MTRHTAPQKLTEFDLMMIRAGGRTEAEFETMVKNEFGFGVLSNLCSFLADTLYRVVVLLEAGAQRTTESSHRRLAVDASA